MWLKRSSYKKDLNILVDHKLNMRQQDEETAKGLMQLELHDSVQIKGAISPWKSALVTLGTTKFSWSPSELKLSSTGPVR